MAIVTNLSKNIIATLTYYDVIDYPLTPYELWRFLISYDGKAATDRVELRDIFLVLETREMQKRVVFKNGFICLFGREQLVALRIQREKLSARKLSRMKKLVRKMVFLPYVRMIGATGSLSLKFAQKESDWDMFVVLEKGNIWMGRFVLALYLQILGKRRHGNKVEDRACLNYFVTTDGLLITNQDLYGANEYQTMRLLWGRNMYTKFLLANRWIADIKPNFALPALSERFTVSETGRQKQIQGVFESFCGILPGRNSLTTWQKQKIAKNPKTALLGSHIEATDQVLVFLPKPKGPQVFSEFKQRLIF